MTDLSKAMSFVDGLEIVHMAPDELAHHGVLGMKWGRHLAGRTQASHNPRPIRESKKVHFNQTSTGTTSKKKYPFNSSSDHVTSRELKSRKTHSLSNNDIQKVIDRLQKEQSLKRLDPDALARGKTAVAGALSVAALYTAGYKFVTSKAGQDAIARGSKIVKAFIKSRSGRTATAQGVNVVKAILAKSI